MEKGSTLAQAEIKPQMQSKCKGMVTHAIKVNLLLKQAICFHLSIYVSIHITFMMSASFMSPNCAHNKTLADSFQHVFWTWVSFVFLSPFQLRKEKGSKLAQGESKSVMQSKWVNMRLSLISYLNNQYAPIYLSMYLYTSPS